MKQYVPAVYAVYSDQYQANNASEWNSVQHIGVTSDLMSSIVAHMEKHGSNSVANIRALTFTFPEPNAMQQVAQTWRQQAYDAGCISSVAFDEHNIDSWSNDIIGVLDDEDDDDEESFNEDYQNMQMASRALDTKREGSSATDSIVSPFDNKEAASVLSNTGLSDDADQYIPLTLTVENVDKVLNEVRPYLIADGGNVSVESVDESKRLVYLKLEGACGSCPSSTVTMQMGIERILKEKFSNLAGVCQVNGNNTINNGPGTTSSQYQLVAAELNRIRPAITAMGGAADIVNVDESNGIVEVKYRGAKRVQQGLELALLDVAFVNEVKFVE
jgi:Fe-S cluster biogenesis protein NfuA